MIKVNLLDSVTERTRSVAAVEAQVANPRTRTMLLGFVVIGLMFVGMGVDWVSARSARATAEADLRREEDVAARMEAINKEQAELEKKIKDIQVRIDAIKKLRSSQQGPVAVLSAINERIPSVPDFRLESIEQKEGSIIIEGHSPNESAVTQFGRSLEFSSGLFSNVGIETERKELTVAKDDLKPGQVIDENAAKPETVHFKVTCKYSPPNVSAGGAQPAAKDAQKSGVVAVQPAKQLAKN